MRGKAKGARLTSTRGGSGALDRSRAAHRFGITAVHELLFQSPLTPAKSCTVSNDRCLSFYLSSFCRWSVLGYHYKDGIKACVRPEIYIGGREGRVAWSLNDTYPSPTEQDWHRRTVNVDTET